MSMKPHLQHRRFRMALPLLLALGCSTEAATAPTPTRDWTCDTGYELASYEGDERELCAANESVWRSCCLEQGGELPEAIDVRCAPDKSACVADDSCSLFVTTTAFECGWISCDPVNGGPGGAGGGGAASTCDWELAAATFEAHVSGDRGLVACAADQHCEPMNQVCNRRLYNRMFCGDAENVSLGGAGQ